MDDEFIRENPIKHGMIWGGNTPIFGNTHMWIVPRRVCGMRY